MPADLDIERVFDDFKYFAESCLKVQDKQTQRFVPFVLKPVQVRLADAFMADLRAGVPSRYIILKARREGVSTLIQAWFFWYAVTNRNQAALTMSHHDDTTKALFRMTENFYKNLPRQIRPMRKASRTGEVLELANDTRDLDLYARNPGNESTLRTVTFKNAGAGQAASQVHLSEVGLWGNEADVTLDTVLQVIPDAVGTVVAIESTARGVGNAFNRRWNNAVRSELAGVPDFVPFFIAWFEEPTARDLGQSPYLGELDAEEQSLVDRFGVSGDQLAWRRRTIREKCGGSLDTFHQEYPATAEEAFLASGRPFFDQQSVSTALKEAISAETVWRGDLVEENERIRPVPSSRGLLKVWKMPEATEDYLIACDSSEGSKQNDPQCAYVLSRTRLEVVAGWHGYVDRSDLGDVLYRLGKVYNDALIAVELSGGWGETPQAILRRRGYPRLYRRRDENKNRAQRERKYGWLTTQTTRALALDSLREALLEGDLIANDPELLRECLTFVYDETGKPRAESGLHDDRVMACAIACYLWHTEVHIKRKAYTQRMEPRRPLSAITGY